MKEDRHVEFFLTEPKLPSNQVEIGDDPARGPETAAVVVVEFSDYLCPACRKAHEVAEKVRKKYEDHIRWVFKDFPLERHEGADKMAEAAHCAREQDGFWRYQDQMFFCDENPDREKLVNFAKQCSLDAGEFEKCLESCRHRETVQRNVKNGMKAGVTATPTFIVNGRIFSGALSQEEFIKWIESALERAKEKA